MSQNFIARQHLIDPEVCIRCNTCEETCEKKAVTHDCRNYVIDYSLCNACGDCLPPCPTGAIDSWRLVLVPHPLDAQFKWDALPADSSPVLPPPSDHEEGAAVAKHVELSSIPPGLGPPPPPSSAAHAYVGLYSRDRPVVATVSGNYRLTQAASDVDIRHIVLDLGHAAFPLLEGQSVGVIPPGLDALGQPHSVRLYSVASPRDGERPGYNNLALTVKRVTRDREGRAVRGVASNYLCDLQRGAEVQLTGPYGSSFLMPDDVGADLLLVCTGTGAAPMRAMTERRRRRLRPHEGGSITLFFGARSPEELPYFGPLVRLPRELVDSHFAFSRVIDQPRYVQDRIREDHEHVAKLLSGEKTFVYVCGHKPMEVGVRQAFADVCAQHGLDWDTTFAQMHSDGRFHIETY